MIEHPAFPVEPWGIRETSLDLGVLGQAESLFALSNGHIGLRGNLDEGEPHGLPGSYLNGFFEGRPLPYSEAGYGYPEAGETVVNVTDGKVIRLLVDDEPFDVRYGTLLSHERLLDFRAGVLRRRARWQSPANCTVQVSSTRLVSLAQRAVAAVLYEVEPVGREADVVVQSELAANEPLPPQDQDPRTATVLRSLLRSEQFGHHDQRVVLIHATGASRLRLAAGMDHVVDGPADTELRTESGPDLGRLIISAHLGPGPRLRLI